MMIPYKYEGPRSEAIAVRNREADTKVFELPEIDAETGRPKRNASGRKILRRVTLGSIVDEELAEEGKGIGPEVLIARRDWDLALEQPAVRQWLNGKPRRIDANRPQ